MRHLGNWAHRTLLAMQFVGVVAVAWAQGERDIWYFGQHAGLDFSGGEPVPLADGMMDTNEGCAVATDASGQLLFYSDGVSVWHRDHGVMTNGTGLMGSSTTTQSCAIAPKPGSPSLYYVFTAAQVGSWPGLRYSVVDLSLGGGLGDITAEKNIPVLAPITEKLLAVPHANAVDTWILVHAFGDDAYHAFLVTANGVGTPAVVSHVGTVITGGPVSTGGYLKCDASGTRLASALLDFDQVELLHFDRTSGIVSDPMLLPCGPYPYGLEFSPSGNRLYVSTGSAFLHQFDLAAGSVADIVASHDSIGPGPFGYHGAMQTGPDGRIYVAQFSGSLGVIDQPDEALPLCGFDPAGLQLAPGTASTLGLPVFIAAPTWHTGGVTPRTGREALMIAPNPARTEVTIALPALRSNAWIEIRSSDGQVVKTVFVTGCSIAIDIRALAIGRYICSSLGDKGERMLGSFIKE